MEFYSFFIAIHRFSLTNRSVTGAYSNYIKESEILTSRDWCCTRRFTCTRNQFLFRKKKL